MTGSIMRRRVARYIGTALCLTLVLVGSTSLAQEEPVGFDIQQFNPMPDQRQNFLSAASADIAPHLSWSALLFFHHANDPLVLVDDDGNRLRTVVGSQSTLNMLFSLSLLDRIELGLDIPLILAQSVEDQPTGSLGGLPGPTSGFAIGDIRFVPKLQLYSNRADAADGGVALAFIPEVFIPSGDSSRFSGGEVRGNFRFAFDVRAASGFLFGLNLGYLMRPNADFLNVQVRDMLGWAVAAEVPVADPVRLTGELTGRISLSTDELRREDTPMELLLGAKFHPGLFYATAGGGAGLIAGYGTPNWRLFAGLGLATPRPPREAPPEPECTQENVTQRCVYGPMPSCIDGRVTHYSATCSTAGTCEYLPMITNCLAGTTCGYEAGIPACVVIPECTMALDCTSSPPPSCDAGVLTTYAPRCGAGACYYDPATSRCAAGEICGFRAGHAACVPEPRARIDEETQQIVILDIVYFAVNSDEIETRSYAILNDVADLLLDNPQIRVRIEGHTDNTGSRRLNVDLSDRRAASVRRYLIGEGVSADRLDARGYGPDDPIDTNDTADGRSRNRRVEFHIVEQ